MFSGGDYEEVGRWLWNFVTAHAKRENLRVEAMVDMADARAGQSYGVRLILGDRWLPPASAEARSPPERFGGVDPETSARCGPGQGMPGPPSLSD